MQTQQHHPGHGYTLPPVHPYVKTEPMERPYVSLAPHPQQMQQYMLPPIKNRPAGQNVLALPRGAPLARPPSQPTPPTKTSTPTGAGGSGGRLPQLDGPSFTQAHQNEITQSLTAASAARFRIPQVDGPASTGSSSDPESPDPSTSPGKQPTGEEINSDLDDSDSDNDNGDDVGSGQADQDIVFCTYDKVRFRHHRDKSPANPLDRLLELRTSGSAR
jgi:transcription initiation factor TFIIA large subunit